jgi:hypothetical protein
MYPRRFDVEVQQHLVDHEWIGRQGAWLIRSFPNLTPASYLPYYIEYPSVRAFFPLNPDGKSYDLARATIFPIARSATQLAASGELAFQGGSPEWAVSSGTQKYPRRFALRLINNSAVNPGLTLHLDRAHGRKIVRFAVQLESPNPTQTRQAPVHLKLTQGSSLDSPSLWQTNLASVRPEPTHMEIAAGESTGELHLVCEHLLPTDTLWFYEFELLADDFNQ